MSFINEAAKQVKKIQTSYDIVKEGEREYERQRQNNHTKLIQNAVESAVGRGLGLVGNLSYSSLRSDNFGGDNISAPDLIPPRAVGPLEDMPLDSVISDSIRLQNVLKNTQVEAEHRLRAKTELQKRSFNSHGNEIRNTTKELSTILREDLEQKEAEYSNYISRIRAEGYLGDSWTKDNQYTLETNIPDFDFVIENLAMADGKMKFPARISRYNESNGASWDSLGFVNAVEDQYIYQRGDKSFDLEFTIFAATDEILIDDRSLGTPLLTRKAFGTYLEFLNKLNRVRLDSSGRIAATPYIKLTLGQMIVEQLAIFESVNIAYDPNVWDYSVGNQAPIFATISISGKYLFGQPDVNTKYYGEAYE